MFKEPRSVFSHLHLAQQYAESNVDFGFLTVLLELFFPLWTMDVAVELLQSGTFGAWWRANDHGRFVFLEKFQRLFLMLRIGKVPTSPQI